MRPLNELTNRELEQEFVRALAQLDQRQAELAERLLSALKPSSEESKPPLRAAPGLTS